MGIIQYADNEIKPSKHSSITQPIAIVLGSDGLPARIRLYDTQYKRYTDLWFTDSQFDTLFSSSAERYVTKVGNRWTIHGYSWLPTVDINNNIVQDGLTLIEDIDPPFRLFILGRVGRVQDAGRKDQNLGVVDARGNYRVYKFSKLWQYANQNKPSPKFTNIDYSLLRTSEGTPALTRSSFNTSFDISNISADVGMLSVFSMANSKPATVGLFGSVTLDNPFYGSKVQIVPDFMTDLTFMLMSDNIAEVLTLPRVLHSLNLTCTDDDNLKVINMSEQITAGHRFNLKQSIRIERCNKLAQIDIPVTSDTNLNLCIDNCDNVRTIKPCGSSTRGSASLYLMLSDMPNLEEILLEGYSFTGLTIRRCPKLKTIKLSPLKEAFSGQTGGFYLNETAIVKSNIHPS